MHQVEKETEKEIPKDAYPGLGLLVSERVDGIFARRHPGRIERAK